MPTNTLTDAQCKRAAAVDKPRKFFDGHGLHLWVTPAGVKTWRMAYRLEKKPQTATFGSYPLVASSSGSGSPRSAAAATDPSSTVAVPASSQ